MSEAEINEKLNSVVITFKKMVNGHGELHLNEPMTKILFEYIDAKNALLAEMGAGLKKIEAMAKADI